MRQVTVEDVVRVLGGSAQWIVGPRTGKVSRPIAIDSTWEDGGVSFSSAEPGAAVDAIAVSRAVVALCRADVRTSGLETLGKTIIGVENPRRSFIRIVSDLFAPTARRGIHPTAEIHPDAELGDEIYVGPFAYLGDCKVGDESVIHGHVHVGDGTVIGSNVTIHAGTVIGADGFGYERNEAGIMEKFPHVGGVVIEDDVEIGSNTCVDRGSLENTLIRRGAKVDNLVHVAHNVVIGVDAVVIAHAMIGGGVDIGDRAWVAPGAIIRNTIDIGAEATIGLGAVVTKSVPAQTTVIGNPARPYEKN